MTLSDMHWDSVNKSTCKVDNTVPQTELIHTTSRLLNSNWDINILVGPAAKLIIFRSQSIRMVNEEKQIFELIEVEDIVPMGANSLFLCVARTIIYLTYKNPHLLNILKSRLRINADLFKSDVALQFQLRIKLCEYFLKNGVQFDDQTKTFKLKYR